MKSFKICYVSAEVKPFASTPFSTDLALTASQLPMALKELDQDVRLMMPKYKSINDRKYVLREVIRLREVTVQLGNETKVGNGKTAFLPNSKVHVYFLSIPELFDRKGFYIDPQTGEPFEDNAERFGFFCKSVLETLKLLYWQPDIIHCTDWSTALIPYYLKTKYKDDDFFESTRTVLTVHNLHQAGIFDVSENKILGIEPKEVEKGGAFELNGQLSFLKGGIHFADAVNFTSQTLLKNILSDPAFAPAFHEVIKKRGENIVGITSGTDYNEWNPSGDKFLTSQYDETSMANRKANKTTIYNDLKLDKSAAPLISIPLNFQSAKDVALVKEVLADILNLNVAVSILNTGEYKSLPEIKELHKKYPKKLALRERYDNRFAHLLLGSADIFFFPSEHSIGEQLHLNCLRYGVIPVAYLSGPIADVMQPYENTKSLGNCFGFDRHDAESALSALKKALEIFDDQKIWMKIQKNAMATEYSWQKTAEAYLELYEKASK